ncbi:RING finger family protein [Hirschfeldia incana]|nr:RING finger family protein [Hirschfeldia incana]KAJ0252451.1 RING finger family protein [Hirschfeldia incana]
MGNACCVAARDKMVLVVPAETERRPSPTWSFRWDNNRGRVAGEDSSSLTWLSDGLSRNGGGSDLKFESAFVSSQASPLNSFRTQTSHKSPASDLSFPINSSMDTVFEQKENDSTQSVAPSYPSPTQLSPSQTSSFPASPLSPQSYLHPSSSSSLKLTQRPRLSKQVTDGQIYGMNSLSRSSATEERQGTPLRSDSSQSGPSESWSLQAFSEMMSSSRSNEPLSYDNGCFGLDRDNIDNHGNRVSNRHQQTCGACSRPLSEKSLWSSQKIFITNELSVSAILACGHVYHGECLEQMTLEVDKFDPSCPICTMGEKKTAKMSEKALKVEMDLKARHNKRLRNRVLDSDFDCDDFVMYDHSHMAAAGKSPELVSSSSGKGYSAKPFLARHFSFGSRGNSKSAKENLAVKKKGFFWTKSSKI